MRLSTQNEVAFNTALNTVEAELLSGEVNRANGLLNDINTAHASGAVGVQIFCMRWRVSGLVPHLVGEGQDLVSGLTRKGLPPDEASDFANAHTDLLARLEAIQNTLEDIRGRALTRGAPLDETTLSQFSGALKKFETSLTALETSDQLHITTPKDGGPRNISELTTLRNMLKDSEALETSLKGHLPPEVQLPQLSNEYYARAAIALGKPVAGDPQALRNDPIIKGQAQIEVFDEFLFRLGIATRHDTMSRLKARNPATYRTWMDGKIAEYSKGSETDKIKARQGLINGGRSALDSASSQQVGRVFETLGTDSLHVIYTDLAQAQKPGGRARLLPRLISGEMRLGPAEPALEIVFARLAHVFDLETIDPNVQRDILDEMTNYSYRSGDGARPFEQILRRNLTNATVCQRVLDHMYTQDPVGGTRLIDLFLMDATQPFNREVDRVTVPAYLKELGENYLGRFQVQQKPIWVGKWSNLFTRDAIEVNDKLTRDLGDALSTKSNPLYAPRWWLNPRYAMRSPWSSGFFGGLGSSLSIGTNVFVTLLPLIVAFDSGNVVLTRERPAAEWYLRPAGNLTHKLFFEQTPQEELDKRLEKAVTAAELPESLVPKLSGLTARQISDFEVVVAKFKEAVDGKDILDNVTRKFVSPGSKETAEQYIQELQTIQGYISKGYWAASSGNTDRKIKSCAAFSQMEIPSREHKVNNPVFEGVRTDKTLSPLIADHLSDLLDKGFSKEQIINVWNVSGMAAATFDKYLVRLSNLSSVYSSSIAKRLCTGKDAEFKWINITQFELALQKAEGLSTGQVSRELTFAKIVLETVVDASDTQNLLKFAESNSVSEAQRVDVEIALSKVLYSPVPGTNVTLMAVYVDNPTRLFDQLTDFVDFHTKNGTVNVARLNSE